MATKHPSKNSLVRDIFIPILLIVSAAVAGLAIIKYNTGPVRPSSSLQVEVGAILPNLELQKLDGKRMPLSDLKAKVFLINFWATWCEACMDEMPSLVKLYSSLNQKGLEVLGVNLDEEPEAVVPKSIKKFGIQFPIFKDFEGKLSDLFDVRAIPLTVVLNSNRKILYIQNGDIDWYSQTMKSKFESWLAE